MLFELENAFCVCRIDSSIANAFPNYERASAVPRLRFRLRTLLLFLTAIGVWGGWYVNRVNEQRTAAETVARLGGSVAYGPDGFSPAAARNWLERIASLAGPDLFFRVTGVELSDNKSLMDEDLDCLKAFPKLRWLRLHGTGIGDAGLRHIEQLPNLRLLHLRATQVTDKGTQSISCLSRLEHLYLIDTTVGDEGVRNLSGLVQLQTLCLDKSRVTGECLRWLSDMNELRELGLSETDVCGQGLKDVHNLERLDYLNLANTKLTQAAAAILGSADNVNVINVFNTPLDEAGKGTYLPSAFLRQSP